MLFKKTTHLRRTRFTSSRPSISSIRRAAPLSRTWATTGENPELVFSMNSYCLSFSFCINLLKLFQGFLRDMWITFEEYFFHHNIFITIFLKFGTTKTFSFSLVIKFKNCRLWILRQVFRINWGTSVFCLRPTLTWYFFSFFGVFPFFFKPGWDAREPLSIDPASRKTLLSHFTESRFKAILRKCYLKKCFIKCTKFFSIVTFVVIGWYDSKIQ